MIGGVGPFSYVPSATINLLMVMVLIWTSGVIFRRINQPPMLGELLAGIIFGPSLLGIINPDPMLSVLSELGIFFLMFYAGLETDVSDLKKSAGISTVVGAGGFFVPLALGYFVCKYYLGFDTITALFVGLGLSITAIAISARLLNDMGLQGYRVTPVILGAAVMDDVLALASLSAIIGLVASGGVFDWKAVAFIMLEVFVFFGVAIFVGLKLLPKVSRYYSSREAKGFTSSLIVALLFGMMAEFAGLHVIIGAYLAGLFVRKGIASEELFLKVSDRMVSITYGFLGPIFFVSLSFHVTFSIFRDHLLVIIVLVLAATTGKLLGAGLAAYLRKMTLNESAVVAFSMNGRGAVELIIASIGLEFGIIDDTIFSILILMAFITTIISPLSLGMLLKKIRKKGLVPLEHKPEKKWLVL